MSEASRRVLPVANLREFFKDSLQGALAKQRLAVEDQTEHYVVNLLTLFARSEALYERTPEGMRLRPLVAILCEALEASSVAERNRALQRLGDVSLFIAGFFARSFAARLIDVDYHVAMGGRASSAENNSASSVPGATVEPRSASTVTLEQASTLKVSTVAMLAINSEASVSGTEP